MWPSPTINHTIKRPIKAASRTARLQNLLQSGCLQQVELHALEWPHRPRGCRAPCTAPQIQPPPGMRAGPAEKLKATRTKLPICFPAGSAQGLQTTFFSAPFPCARCCYTDPRTEPGGTAPAVNLPTRRPRQVP